MDRMAVRGGTEPLTRRDRRIRRHDMRVFCAAICGLGAVVIACSVLLAFSG